jgi:hypothetical protein
MLQHASYMSSPDLLDSLCHSGRTLHDVPDDMYVPVRDRSHGGQRSGVVSGGRPYVIEMPQRELDGSRMSLRRSPVSGPGLDQSAGKLRELAEKSDWRTVECIQVALPARPRRPSPSAAAGVRRQPGGIVLARPE